MNLCVDIGNTRTKVAIYKGVELLGLEYCENGNIDQLLKIATNQKVDNIVLSTVGRGFEEEGIEELKQKFNVIELSHKTPLPIDIIYDTPHTLGLDRIAAVVGAWDLYPGEDCLVVDAGTCITLDVITKEGAFLGGNISPGIMMRLKAMNHYTAALPLPERKEVKDWMGKSTETALLNGAQLGAQLEIEGMIELCKQKFGKIKVILTGGDANYFGKKIKKQIFVRPNLVLNGLNKILNYNVGNEK